jgi:hypothetical protein
MQLSEQEIRMIEILLRAGEDFSVVIERPQGALHIVVSAVSKGANRAWDDMIPYAGLMTHETVRPMTEQLASLESLESDRLR